MCAKKTSIESTELAFHAILDPNTMEKSASANWEPMEMASNATTATHPAASVQVQEPTNAPNAEISALP